MSILLLLLIFSYSPDFVIGSGILKLIVLLVLKRKVLLMFFNITDIHTVLKFNL